MRTFSINISNVNLDSSATNTIATTRQRGYTHATGLPVWEYPMPPVFRCLFLCFCVGFLPVSFSLLIVGVDSLSLVLSLSLSLSLCVSVSLPLALSLSLSLFLSLVDF
jgi:hypothetical protein